MTYILLQNKFQKNKNLHIRQKSKFTNKLKETMANVCHKLRMQQVISKHDMKSRSNKINGHIRSHENLKLLQGKIYHNKMKKTGSIKV